ncbi:MAG: HEAT repeat domain-containing protein [Planctomycetota bacterium]|nr:HEAT repeat domain-containing protein [Planctomycetota bacterium]
MEQALANVRSAVDSGVADAILAAMFIMGRRFLRQVPIVTGLVLALAAACGVQRPLQAAEPPPKEDPVDPDVLRKIRKLIKGTLATDATERETAWKALKDMANLAVPGLVALQRDKETTPEMRRSILIALGDTRDPRAGPALVEMLAADDARVRRDAARAIGDSGYRDAVPALEKLAAKNDEEETVRLFAATAGARLGSEKALECLAGLAQSPRPEIRSRAVFALGKYGGVKQAPLLEKALGDTDRDVREDAVAALRIVAKKEAWGSLVKAIGDTDYKVRNAAMDALRELTGQKIENDPAAWKAWWAKEEKKPEPAKE